MLDNIKQMLEVYLARHLIEIKRELALDLSEGNFKVVKARIRNGKVQRKKKVSTKPGYTYRNGKLTRMGTKERQKRKMGARRGKLKRKSKMARTLIARKRSMRKRAALGV